MLDAGLAAGEQPELAAEEIASWLDGRLGRSQCCRCRRKPAGNRRRSSPKSPAPSASAMNRRCWPTLRADLTQRLLELGPQPAKWRFDGVAAPLPVASPLPPPIVKPDVSAQPRPVRR